MGIAAEDALRLTGVLAFEAAQTRIRFSQRPGLFRSAVLKVDPQTFGRIILEGESSGDGQDSSKGWLDLGPDQGQPPSVQTYHQAGTGHSAWPWR